MKKLLFVLMACAAIFAVSCNKDDSSKKKSGDKTNKYEAPIKIDGDFADWAAIDESKMSIAKCNPKSGYMDLSLMKVYCDELYLYVYIEYDFAKWVAGETPVTASKFDMVFNCDNDQSTGGYSGTWDDTPCFDALVEGHFILGGNYEDYVPGIFKWDGEAQSPDWLWGDEDPASQFLKEAKFVPGEDKGAAELKFDLYQYPWGYDSVKETFTLGAFICTNGDDATGALPNKASDDSVTPNKHLTVHMNK